MKGLSTTKNSRGAANMSDRLEEPLDGEILPNGEGTVHMVGDEMLTEIEVSEEPPDDDTSTIWTDDGDDYGLEEVTDNPALDSDAEEMALFKFDGHRCHFLKVLTLVSSQFVVLHSDSVYCAAVHPKQKGVVITGNVYCCKQSSFPTKFDRWWR